MVFCSGKKDTTDPKPRWEILDFLTRQVEIHLRDRQKVWRCPDLPESQARVFLNSYVFWKRWK